MKLKFQSISSKCYGAWTRFPKVSCLSMAARVIFGPLPYYLVFAINEALVLTMCLSLGVCNVNAVFHILLIFHSR